MCRYVCVFPEQISSWCVGEWDESGDEECEKNMSLSFTETQELSRIFSLFFHLRTQHPLTNCLRIKDSNSAVNYPMMTDNRIWKTISQRFELPEQHVLTWKISRNFARKLPSFPRNRVHSRRLRFGLHSSHATTPHHCSSTMKVLNRKFIDASQMTR